MDANKRCQRCNKREAVCSLLGVRVCTECIDGNMNSRGDIYGGQARKLRDLKQSLENDRG